MVAKWFHLQRIYRISRSGDYPIRTCSERGQEFGIQELVIMPLRSEGSSANRSNITSNICWRIFALDAPKTHYHARWGQLQHELFWCVLNFLYDFLIAFSSASTATCRIENGSKVRIISVLTQTPKPLKKTAHRTWNHGFFCLMGTLRSRRTATQNNQKINHWYQNCQSFEKRWNEGIAGRTNLKKRLSPLVTRLRGHQESRQRETQSEGRQSYSQRGTRELDWCYQ